MAVIVTEGRYQGEDAADLVDVEVPSFELADMETPTSYNPLGAKGIG